MSLIRFLASAFLFVLAIPTVGYLSAVLIQYNVDKKFSEGLQEGDPSFTVSFAITEVCTRPGVLEAAPQIAPICAELEQFNTLEVWSAIAGLVGIAYLVCVFLAGAIARKSRVLLVRFFKPGLKLTQLTISGLALAHGAILIAAIYYTESYWFGKVHFVLLGIAGLVIGITALRIFASSFASFKTIEATVLGRAISRKDAPKLWNLVDEVASHANTTSPDNLIVGMSPTFFVTEAKVNNLDGKARGRTLYLSLPFCRLLSVSELKAIIAHELGHFVGLDTRFSRQFYPIYRGAARSIQILHEQTEGEGGLHTLALLPSMFLMNYFISAFSNSENKISRIRELEADALAGRLFGKSEIASALVKIHAFSNVWSYTESKMLDALSAGKQLINASHFFETVANNLPQDFIAKGLEDSHTEHPTDSHPPLKARLDALGVKLTSDLLVQASKKAEDPASSIVDNAEELESILTEFEHQKLSGTAKQTESFGQEDMSFRLILLRSLVLMMLIDDKVTDGEIITLKNIFKQLTDKDLSDAEIRLEISKINSGVKSLFVYLETSEVLLKKEAKEILLKALILMAAADGEFNEDERNLLGRVAVTLNVEVKELERMMADLSSESEAS